MSFLFCQLINFQILQSTNFMSRKKLMYEKELSMESSPLKCVDHRNHRDICNYAILKKINVVDKIEND